MGIVMNTSMSMLRSIMVSIVSQACPAASELEPLDVRCLCIVSHDFKGNASIMTSIMLTNAMSTMSSIMISTTMHMKLPSIVLDIALHIMQTTAVQEQPMACKGLEAEAGRAGAEGSALLSQKLAGRASDCGTGAG